MVGEIWKKRRERYFGVKGWKGWVVVKKENMNVDDKEDKINDKRDFFVKIIEIKRK